MKFQIAAAILAAFVILTGFGVAANTGETTIQANIGDEFDLQIDRTHIQYSSLNSGENLQDAALIVDANGPWSVTVKSDRPDGKMREYNYDHYIVDATGHSLYFPLHVWQSTTGIVDVVLTDQDQPFITRDTRTGTGIVTTIQFKQSINLYDVRLEYPMVYHIVVTFTGGLSY